MKKLETRPLNRVDTDSFYLEGNSTSVCRLRENQPLCYIVGKILRPHKNISSFASPPAPHFKISWKNFTRTLFRLFWCFYCLTRFPLILFSHTTPFTHFSTIKWGIPSYGYHDEMFWLSWMSKSENILEICGELSGFSMLKNAKNKSACPHLLFEIIGR